VQKDIVPWVGKQLLAMTPCCEFLFLLLLFYYSYVHTRLGSREFLFFLKRGHGGRVGVAGVGVRLAGYHGGEFAKHWADRVDFSALPTWL
jgi:hypothetical protein